MRPIRWAPLASLLLSAPLAAQTAEGSAWDATQAVVAGLIGAPGSTRAVVIESWAGDLRLGDAITVPGLVPGSTSACAP